MTTTKHENPLICKHGNLEMDCRPCFKEFQQEPEETECGRPHVDDRGLPSRFCPACNE